MGYPATYRNPRPSTGFPSTPRPRPRGQVVRFPIRRPFARGRFGPPTALPGRPGFGLRPPAPVPMAPGRSPVVLPGLPLGRFAGLMAAGLYAYDLYRSWNDGQSGNLIDPSPANGWAHICGPIAWPGPPYLKSIIRVHGAGILTTPRCGLGLQVAIPNAPYGTARNVVDYYQHGTLQNRGYVMNQWSRSPADGVAPPLRVHYPTQDIRVNVGTLTDAFGLRPPLQNSGPLLPMPPSFGRLFNAPGWPEGPRRGYTHPDNDGSPYDVNFPVTQDGTRLHVVTVSRPRDREPDVRERERKAEAASRIGRMAISGFRGLQTWASVNGAIDALWNAIPRSYRPRGRRSWWQKYQDVYENFDRIDLAAAARNSVLFAAQQRAYGAFFGAITNGLVQAAGPNTGWGIYRGLVNRAGNPDPAPWPSARSWYTSPKEGTRRGPNYRPPVDFGARPRVYSGRAGPRRRREQTVLRSIGRKFWWARRRNAARYWY